MNKDWMREFVRLVETRAQFKLYEKNLGLSKREVRMHSANIEEFRRLLAEPKPKPEPKPEPQKPTPEWFGSRELKAKLEKVKQEPVEPEEENEEVCKDDDEDDESDKSDETL